MCVCVWVEWQWGGIWYRNVWVDGDSADGIKKQEIGNLSMVKYLLCMRSANIFINLIFHPDASWVFQCIPQENDMLVMRYYRNA